jgi:hypothetical protein
VAFGCDSNVRDGEVCAETVSLALTDLSHGWSLRGGHIDRRHVGLLMELSGAWPPIVVWGPTNVIVDGAHRVAAAQALGMSQIEAARYEGSEDAAYLHAVRCNVRHGLPLTIEDRMRAVARVMTDHPEWSDRRIARACSVSVMTVGKVRAERPTVGEPESGYRVGRDGKWRPVKAATVREKIVQELERDNTRSLRAIASIVGASPETVRSVRRSIMGQEVPADPPVKSPPSTPSKSDQAPCASATLRLVTDVATMSGVYGEGFAMWFDSVAITDDWEARIDCVPQSRIYEIADEARRRSARWAGFAQALEARVRRPAILRA